MKYEIKWKLQPLNFINKLQYDIAIRIWNKLEQIREDPFRYLKSFKSKDFYKLRIGKYRALIDVDSEKRIIFVQVLDKRSRIYKK